MQIVSQLLGFGLKQVLGDAAGNALDAVLGHFSDHSKALPQALGRANDRAWQALGIALAGNGFVDQLKVFFASGDAKGIRVQVEAFLTSNAISFEGSPAGFRKQCLAELNQLRKQGHLSAATLPARELAQRTAGWQRYADLPGLVAGANRAVAQMATELHPHAPNLSRLLAQPTPGGPPLLVAAFAYFFRREVVANDDLVHELLVDGLQQLSASQARAFAEVGKALHSLREELGERFDTLFEQLDRIEDKIEGVGDKIEQMKAELSAQIADLARRAQVQAGAVKANLPITIHNERERQLARRLLAEVRKLPPEKQSADDLVLLGDVLRAAGLFGESKESYGVALARTDDHALQAAALYKTYLDELEQKHWDAALAALVQAVDLDGRRFAPFPLKG